MYRACWTALIAMAVSLPQASLADEQQDTDLDGNAERHAAASVEALRSDLFDRTSWQLTYPDRPLAYTDTWRQPLSDFEFQEGSTLMRLGKLRSLSLLTVAKFGESRLFLGVNDDGLVGLHFNAFLRGVDERYLEIVRMPYIADTRPDDD